MSITAEKKQKLDIAEGLLIVESQQDDLMVLVRLAPPHPAVRARYEQALGSLTCGTRRKIGDVTRPRPVFERDATVRPFVSIRPSATRRLGPLRR